jgi:hypothetical protein
VETAENHATTALNMIRRTSSDAYSPSKAYKVGEHCIYNNVVYKCITACSAAAWSVNQNCFEETTLTTAVTELNSDLSNYLYMGSTSKSENLQTGTTIVTFSVPSVPGYHPFMALFKSTSANQFIPYGNTILPLANNATSFACSVESGAAYNNINFSYNILYVKD